MLNSTKVIRYFKFSLLFFLSAISGTLLAQPGPARLFTFGVVSDVQYCDCDITGTRHYRSSLQKLNEAIDLFNQKKVDFVISLGDFIDHDFHSFDTLGVIMKRLGSPVHYVMGNHDFSVAPQELKSVPAILHLKKMYYTFKKDQWRFIALDGNEVSTYATVNDAKKAQAAKDTLQALKSRKSSNAQTWNGGISDKQFNWLKKQLNAAQKANEKVIVLCHFPVSPERGRLNLWNYSAVKSLIRQYPNVFAYLNGHDHKGGYQQENGVHYVTFKGMVEKDENAFSTVDAYADHLEITGVGAQQSYGLK
jgi:manganese-dependent ADP-ribose/CDP-alcohol diphosphatase